MDVVSSWPIELVISCMVVAVMLPLALAWLADARYGKLRWWSVLALLLAYSGLVYVGAVVMHEYIRRFGQESNTSNSQTLAGLALVLWLASLALTLYVVGRSYLRPKLKR